MTRSVNGVVHIVGVLVLADWIDRNVVWYRDTFSASYAASDDDGDRHLDGIAGYDLQDTNDQIVAVDYEGTGRLDHLLIYRPGSEKKYWVVERHADGSFQPVFQRIRQNCWRSPCVASAPAPCKELCASAA